MTIQEQAFEFDGTWLNPPRPFTAHRGTLDLHDATGQVVGNVFYTAYVGHESVGRQTDGLARPITFFFNGGPGSSSVWLHLGLGPYRVEVPGPWDEPRQTFDIKKNDHSWLSFTDMVFVDPIGTGFSRATDPEKASDFYGFQSDAEAMSQVVRRLAEKFNAWNRQKYLCGESYGGMRVALLAEKLLSQFGMSLEGLILISPALSLQTLIPSVNNVLPYYLYIQAYADCAHYHCDTQVKVDRSTGHVRIHLAYESSILHYLHHLEDMRLSENVTETLCEEWSEVLALDEEYLKSVDLRIEPTRFTRQLLAKDRKVIGRLDARYLAYQHNAESADSFDPSYDSGILAPFSAAVNQFLRSVLGVDTALTYEILTGKVQPWNWGSADHGFPDVTPVLSALMVRQPGLRLWVATGLYDLATPPSTVYYCLRNLCIPKVQRAAIKRSVYEAGHMMYIDHDSMVAMFNDAQNFFGALGTSSSIQRPRTAAQRKKRIRSTSAPMYEERDEHYSVYEQDETYSSNEDDKDDE